MARCRPTKDDLLIVEEITDFPDIRLECEADEETWEASYRRDGQGVRAGVVGRGPNPSAAVFHFLMKTGIDTDKREAIYGEVKMAIDRLSSEEIPEALASLNGDPRSSQ